jgi:hypothetical protein
MNQMLSCVIHLHPQQETILRYASCTEGHSALDIESRAKKCIQELGLDMDSIESCVSGKLHRFPVIELLNASLLVIMRP